MEEINIEEKSSKEKQYEQFASIGSLSVATKTRSNTKYTREDIQNYLNNIPRYSRELMTVSDFFYNQNGLYKNIINAFTNLPTLDNLVLPSSKTLEKQSDKAYTTYFDKVNTYVDSINMKLTTRRILKNVARYGGFIGYERNANNEFYIQTLPLEWCRIQHKVGNDYQIQFNFKYFDRFYKEEDIEFAWLVHPPEFKKLYNKYKTDKKSSEPEWQPLDIKRTICITWDEDDAYFVPAFSGMFDSLINNEDYKDLALLGQTLDTMKLIVQKVPLDKDGNIQMDANLVKIFHSELMKILPTGANGLTTPLTIEAINFANQHQIKEDLLGKAERGVFINSGFSSSIFADNNNHSGLMMNIETVTANIFAILEKIEDAFNRKFKAVVNSKNYEFRLKFFRTTNININENFERNLKLLDIGGSITTLFSLLGFDAESYMTLLQIEKDLKIKELLTLPPNIHTTSNEDIVKDEGGRPVKEEKDLGDSGSKTRELDSNNK